MGTSFAQFRHDLRTPLNHVIGYGEMLIESLDEKQPGAAALKAVVSRARELVLGIQNLPNDTLAKEARNLLERSALASDIAALKPLLDPSHASDLEKMRQAAEYLTALAAGRPEQRSAIPERDGAVSPSAASVANLLVVDDDSGNRELLRRMLERQGYSVTTAQSGQECLQLLDQRAFDLVLLDVIMPGLSGFEVLSRICASDNLCAVPVIVVSALDESSAAIRCIQMGAEDYLPKPFDPVLLKARIGASLEKKRLRDQEAKYARDLETALAELHGAKDRLVVQEKLASLGALTAGIAHELKNPLNFITNFASLARETADELRIEIGKAQPDREEVNDLLRTLSENLERVENHGKRADRIVRGMLLHSHGQPGRREPTDLNALVEEAVNLAYHGMRAQRGSFNVNIEKDLAPSLPPAAVAPQEISRVVVNIVDNAFYAMEHAMNLKKSTEGAAWSPRIRVFTRDTGTDLEIAIEDNGPGIPPEAAARIFDPFFTTKPAGAGTGLGLSISHDIVRSHGGALTVESEPGRYARFRITLPRADRA